MTLACSEKIEFPNEVYLQRQFFSNIFCPPIPVSLDLLKNSMWISLSRWQAWNLSSWCCCSWKAAACPSLQQFPVSPYWCSCSLICLCSLFQVTDMVTSWMVLLRGMALKGKIFYRIVFLFFQSEWSGWCLSVLHHLQESIPKVIELNHCLKYILQFYTCILLDNDENTAPNSEFTW